MPGPPVVQVRGVLMCLGFDDGLVFGEV